MLIKTRFKGLLLIKNKKFKDKRGYFKEILKEFFNGSSNSTSTSK